MRGYMAALVILQTQKIVHKVMDSTVEKNSTHCTGLKKKTVHVPNLLHVTPATFRCYDRISSEPCGSIWFHRFSAGCRRRMGQDWRPNRAISCLLMTKLLTLAETKIRQSSNSKEREKWVTAGSYFCFCYVLSLRSPEGLMVDLPGLIQYGEARPEFVIIPLLGQVKGEDHTRHHLLHCVNETDSGIPDTL